ncbi:DUF1963 domain-containing protein [Catenulispora sp. NF23]|uniref:DUF1963 domain-containing protein n=1 Tax=Catenulispora pinistramenti TaxID=2705254 RepID=UPI001BA9133E|nr:DUF1963 domain-containing protein [Catenulispora pinistramenti]MBS2537048.1 DUF1963 domain-containing protein [Catenulispora pinistramenti]
MTTMERLASVAREHLSAGDAATWAALLRPGVRLVRDDAEEDDGGRGGGGGGGAVAARLGGVPRLPAGVGWPRWEGHGPLGFVAAVDCAAVDRAAMAGAGARVIYVAADAETVERAAPEQIEVLSDDPARRAWLR